MKQVKTYESPKALVISRNNLDIICNSFELPEMPWPQNDEPETDEA